MKTKKQFIGFTPDQTFSLLSRMGYDGPSDEASMDKFLMASPSAASQMGKYAEVAKKRVSGIKPPVKMAEGGLTPTQAQEDLNQAQATAASDPTDANQETLTDASQAFSTVAVPTGNEMAYQGIENPETLVTPTDVSRIEESNDQLIAAGTGQQAETAPITPSQATAETAQAAAQYDTATVDPTLVGDATDSVLEGVEAATADPSEKATVRGQLSILMDDFEEGTPIWASGAMREASAVMQQRGMGASSMAGQAIMTAAMESAIAIAGQDAQTYATFELQNLNNEQQMTIFKTQQRIAGLFTDQAQENAAKQFNASSENQTRQFFADLETTVSRFNAEQINSIREFNVDQDNAVKMFNKNMTAARDQFNATNDLVIAQANTKWRQDIATLNSETENLSNMENARQANAITQRQMDQVWQKERDIMNFAFTSAESQADRDVQLLLADKSINAENDAATKEALGYIVGSFFF